MQMQTSFVRSGVSTLPRRNAVRAVKIVASANKVESELKKAAVAVNMAAGLAMSSPLAVQAQSFERMMPEDPYVLTDEIRRYLYAVLAGFIIVGGLLAAVTAVSYFDPIRQYRKN